MKKENKNKIRKSKEDFEIEMLKTKIEMAKTGFDRYVNVLVRSAFIDTCTGGAYFNDLFLKQIKNGFEEIDKSSKTSSVKEKLSFEFLGDGFFSNAKTEKEKLEKELEYHKRLENYAKYELKRLNLEQKKKIIIDCIEQQVLWSKQFDRNSALYKKLDKKVKKKNDK